MALYRSFSKLKAVVPEILVAQESSCFKKITRKGPALLYRSHNTLLLNSVPLTSTSTQTCLGRHWVPDSPHANYARLHPAFANGDLLTACNPWGHHAESRRGFRTQSPLTSDSRAQHAKTSNGDYTALKTDTQPSAIDGKESPSSDISTGSQGTDRNPADATQDIDEKKQEEEDDIDEDDPIVARYDETGKPLSNWKRMKILMKAYGYVIIPVHWVIAPVWFGAFYYTVKMGVDIAPFLLQIGVSEDHVNTLKTSGASNALMAYALYKIFTPLRYTVTVGATEMTVRYLRRHGYIKHAPRKEKTYRQSLKETVQEVKDKMDNR